MCVTKRTTTTDTRVILKTKRVLPLTPLDPKGWVYTKAMQNAKTTHALYKSMKNMSEL